MSMTVPAPGNGAHQNASLLEAALVALLATGDLEVAPLPETVLELDALAADDGADRNAIVDVVAKDPALAAVVLRVANSALYAHRPPSVTLHDAVSVLGAGAVQRLALAQHVVALGEDDDGPMLPLRRRASHEALQAALLATLLAPLRDDSPAVAFDCGLLTGCGKLVALQLLENVVRGGDVPPADERTAWTIAERNAPSIQKELARRWSLPAPVTAALAGTGDDAAAVLAHDVDVIVAALAGDVAPADIAFVLDLSTKETQVLVHALRWLPDLLGAFSLARFAT